MSPQTAKLSTGIGVHATRRTGQWRLDLQHIGLGMQDGRRPLDDEERLLLRQSALAIEVILEERYVRFGAILAAVGEELLVGGCGHRRRLHVLDDPLLCADDVAIFERVLREVDVRHGRLRRNLPNGAFYLCAHGRRRRHQRWSEGRNGAGECSVRTRSRG